MGLRSTAEAAVAAIVSVHPHEIPTLMHSAACFFFLLSAYFVILPLRDEGAISLGLNNLPGLFVGSLILTLLAAPASTLIFSLPNLSKAKSSEPKSTLLVGKQGNFSDENPMHSLDWSNHGWFYIIVRISLFLWIALLNLVTISSTWARIIDVMDSEVQDCLASLVPEPHLGSYLDHYLQPAWLGWDHFFSYSQLS